MEFQDENEVLAVARASMGRRVLGILSLGSLGVLLLYIAFARSPEPGWQAFLVVIGLAALWCMNAMRQATANRIELTPTELRDSDGTVIVRLDQIENQDRGFFAFKPSNGFLIRSRTPAPRTWRPGLWWRMGRRIGIGGMTPGSQTKYMAEAIATILASRKDPADL